MAKAGRRRIRIVQFEIHEMPFSRQAVPDLGRIAVTIPELSVKIAGAIDSDLSAHGMRDMTKGFVTRRRGTIP